MEEARQEAESQGAGSPPTLMVVPVSGTKGLGAGHTVAIGYNHDVPHRGRIYHVQTEDSGRSRGTIITHLFHAGVIVATNRTEYEESTPSTGIINLLRESHKSMMRQLVNGLLDGAISRCFGGLVGERQPIGPARVTSESPRLALVPAPAASPIAPEPAPAPEPEPAPDPRAERLRALIEAIDMEAIQAILDDLHAHVAGSLGVALVDYETGMCLGTAGTGVKLEVAAAGNVTVMKAKARLARELGIDGGVEDLLITLASQYHVIRPMGTSLFLYMALDREQGSLALARHQLASAAAKPALQRCAEPLGSV